MKASDAFTVPASREVVWSAVQQLDLIAECMPGAQLLGTTEDGGQRGQITVAFGPTRVKWEGVAHLEVDNAGHQIRVRAQAKDQRGHSRARASVDVLVSAELPETQVQLDSEVEISGTLAAFAKAGGERILSTIVDDFRRNLIAHLAPHPQPVPPSGAATERGSDRPATQVHAFRLVARSLFRAIAAWLNLPRRESRRGRERSADD